MRLTKSLKVIDYRILYETRDQWVLQTRTKPKPKCKKKNKTPCQQFKKSRLWASLNTEFYKPETKPKPKCKKEQNPVNNFKKVDFKPVSAFALIFGKKSKQYVFLVLTCRRRRISFISRSRRISELKQIHQFKLHEAMMV